MLNKVRRALAHAKITMSYRLLPKERCRIVEAQAHGLPLLVMANEDVGRELYFGGVYESRDTAILAKNIRPQDICFDVGGNVGYYTLLFARQAVDGEVHAFEPIPLNYHLLRASLCRNGYGSAQVLQAAVGKTEGSAKFSVARDSAFSSLRDTGRNIEVEVIQTPVITLDGYIRQRSLPRVDILKVDVEGAEEMVLSGATELFQDTARRPRLVMLELYDPNLRPFGTSVAEILEKMSAWGYSPKVADHNGELLPFGASHLNRICNVFFVQDLDNLEKGK
jgi:FkbM family methyltransferase